MDITNNEVIFIVDQIGQLATIAILAFTGMLSTRLTSWIRTWGWLKKDDQTRLVGILADITSGVSSLLVTLATLGIAYAVNWLREPNISTVLTLTFFTWTSAWGLHKVNKIARGIGVSRTVILPEIEVDDTGSTITAELTSE